MMWAICCGNRRASGSPGPAVQVGVSQPPSLSPSPFGFMASMRPCGERAGHDPLRFMAAMDCCLRRRTGRSMASGEFQDHPAAAFHASSRLCCPFPAERVNWPNACISAPSYRRDSAACSAFTRPSLAGTCPGEVAGGTETTDRPTGAVGAEPDLPATSSKDDPVDLPGLDALSPAFCGPAGGLSAAEPPARQPLGG